MRRRNMFFSSHGLKFTPPPRELEEAIEAVHTPSPLRGTPPTLGGGEQVTQLHRFKLIIQFSQVREVKEVKEAKEVKDKCLN